MLSEHFWQGREKLYRELVLGLAILAIPFIFFKFIFYPNGQTVALLHQLHDLMNITRMGILLPLGQEQDEEAAVLGKKAELFVGLAPEKAK